MALSSTVIDVPLNKLDTKTSEKLTENGNFLDLRNIVRQKTGALSKRYGFSQIGSSFSGGLRLDTFNDNLIAMDGSSVWSYSNTQGQFTQRGTLVSALVDSTSIVKNQYTQSRPDSCSYRGFTLTVWEDSRGGIRYAIQNDDTGSYVVADASLSTTSSRAICTAFSGQFLIVYEETGNVLKGQFISLTAPQTLVSSFSITSFAAVDPMAILPVNDNAALLAYTDTTSSTVLGFRYITLSGDNGSYPTKLLVSDAATGGLGLAIDYTSQIAYTISYDPTYGGSTGTVRLNAVSLDFSTHQAATLETPSFSAGQSMGTMGLTVTSTGAIRAYWQYTNSTVSNTFIKSSLSTYTLATNTISVGTPGVFLRSVGLATQPFTVGTSDYVNVVFSSTLQSTVFTARSDGLIVTRMHGELAGGLSTKDTLSHVCVDSLGRYTFPITVKNKLLTETSYVQSSWVNLQKQSLTFASPTFVSDQLGENVHVAGGVISAYDGATVSELGFHVYPEGIGTATATSGGHISDSATYQIAVKYEWVDAQGQIHESAPSVMQPVTTGNSSSSTNTITLTAPTLRLTQKQNVNVVAYRSLAGVSAVLYRDVSVANSATSDTVTITLTQSDTNLGTQEILYTAGGVLPNNCPPAAKVVHKHKGRLFLVGQEDGYNINFSQVQIYGQGVAFSDGFQIRVDPRGGIATCLGSLDSNLIIFKQRAIFYQVGDGPDPTGTTTDYQDPQMIPSDVGCTNQRSIVLTPMGLMFQASDNAGIYLLDRGLGVSYIGSPVEKYNSLKVSSAQLCTQNKEVRFTTYTGECLVYNYLYNEWTVFDNYASQDAVVCAGNYYHLTLNGLVNQEIAGQYNDNGSLIRTRIETNWFRIARLQGFQRIFFFSLLGDFIAHCMCRVSIAYNYEPVYNQVVVFNTETGLGTDTYGSDATYGSASVYGGSNSAVFQFRTKPRQQKCETIKLLIEDIDTLSSNGSACYALASLSFEVGMKTGLRRLGASRTVG